MQGITALSSPVRHVFHARHLPSRMHPMDWCPVHPAQFVTRVSQIFKIVSQNSFGLPSLLVQFVCILCILFMSIIIPVYPNIGAGLRVKRACSSTSDSLCEPLEGHYCTDPIKDGCRGAVEHTKCSPGQYVNQTGQETEEEHLPSVRMGYVTWQFQ